MAVMNAPTERDVKKLFALSQNLCAFPGCDKPIFGTSDEMIGEICHIEARSQEGPRFDPAQTGAERHGFDNLILLCRNHHKIVDDDCRKYPVEWLKEVKRNHEANGGCELSQRDAGLARRLLEEFAAGSGAEQKMTVIKQTAAGKTITQVGGDYYHYENPPRETVVVTPPDGAVSPAELTQVEDWITRLVANTTGRTQSDAFGMWKSRFKGRFKIRRFEQLLSTQMPEAEAWYRQQAAMGTRKLRRAAPELWRNARYGAIHRAIDEMGVEKLAYYAEISKRLKMKTPFTSSKELTKTDLERVYGMALRDAGKA